MCADCRAKVQKGNGSEVRRLLEIIDLEYTSAQQGLYGLASGTSKHEYITQRVENIERMRQRVIDLVGDEQQANELVMEQLDKADKATEQKPEEDKP